MHTVVVLHFRKTRALKTAIPKVSKGKLGFRKRSSIHFLVTTILHQAIKSNSNTGLNLISVVLFTYDKSRKTFYD